MTGTSDKFNSNIPIALTSTPQAQYTDPSQLDDMSNHYSATQELARNISDFDTIRVLFLVAVPAGRFVDVTTPGTGNEAIGIFSTRTNSTAIGFVKDDIAAGTYGIVYRRGINSAFTGLTPGAYYQTGLSGTLDPYVSGSGTPVLGWALTPTDLVVDIQFRA